MSDVPPQLSAALAQRYVLQRVLGKGGMATVYLAHDRKHSRAVALKVLRPDLGGMGAIIGILVGALGVSEAAVPVFIPLWLAGTYAVARTAYRYSVGRRGRELEWVADRLANLALELVRERPALRGAERKMLK